MDDARALLVATADDALLEEVLRWCAALGCAPEVTADALVARRAWHRAPALVLGHDLAPGLAETGMPRRDGVLVAAHRAEDAWATALALGAVDVLVPAEQERALQALSSVVEGGGEAVVVSVVGAVGGAGATTLAVGVGLAAVRRGLSALALDVDPLGGGLDLVTGGEHEEGVRWDDLAGAEGQIGAGPLARVLPRRDGLATLTWSRTGTPQVPAVLPDVLAAAVRTFDVVVADVPRNLDPPGEEVLARSVCTVLVVPEQVRALAAARRLLPALSERSAGTALVTAARPGGLGPGAVGEALGLPVLGRLRHDRALRRAVEHGHGPRRSRVLRRPASAVLDLLGLVETTRRP